MGHLLKVYDLSAENTRRAEQLEEAEEPLSLSPTHVDHPAQADLDPQFKSVKVQRTFVLP